MADTAGLLGLWRERSAALAGVPEEVREAQRRQFAQTAVRAWAGKNGLNIPSTERWFLETSESRQQVRAPFPKTAVAVSSGAGALLEPLANVAGMRHTVEALRGQRESAVEQARATGTSEFGIGASALGGKVAAMLPVYAKVASLASTAARALPGVVPGAFGLASGRAAVLARELPQIESRVALAAKALDTIGVGMVEGAHAAAMAKDGDRVGHAVEGFLEGTTFMAGFHVAGAGARGLKSAFRSRHGWSEAQAGAVDDVARFGEQGVDAGTAAQARAAVAQSGPDAVSKTILGYTEQVALAADRAGFPRRPPVVEPVGSKLRVNMRGPNGESYVAGDARGVDASQAEFLLRRISQYLKQGYHVEGVDGDREAIHAFYSGLEKIHEPVYQRLLPPAPAAKGAKGARPGPVAVPSRAAAPDGTQLPAFLAGGAVRIPGVDGKPVLFPHVDAALKDVRGRADGTGKRFLERELQRDRRGNGKGVLARLRHEATLAGYEFEALSGKRYAFTKLGDGESAKTTRKVFANLDDAVAFADENLREPLTTPELVDMAMVHPAFRRVAVNHLAGDVLPPSGGRPVTTVPGGPEAFELPRSGVSVASFYTRPFYAWLNSWSAKNNRRDVYEVFRDADAAQLQRDLFAIPYAKTVREVFRGVKPSRRHDWYRYLEAGESDRAGLVEQLKLSADEVGRLERARREFFDPLFDEFGFDARQYIRDYAPRVRRDLEAVGAARNADVYLARGVDGVPGAEFWAEQARTGALDVYDTDLQRVMLAYLRQGSLKKFLGPHFERMESVANELAPGTEQFKVGAVRDHLLRQAQFLRGMPDKSQRVLDGFIGGTIGGINGMIEQANKVLPKAARLEKIDTPPREVLGNLIATQYAGALGLRAMVPIRDTTPLFLTAYPLLGGKYVAQGMAKATQLKEAVRVANHYGALLHSGDLRSFYTAERATAGGALSKAREWMLDSLSWGDNVVRLVSFWGGHGKALDAIKGFAAHRDPKRLARESGLWFADSIERDRLIAEAAKAAPDKWSDIAFRISRELVETVNPRIRRGAEPGMSKFAVGRIFGMYGTWPLTYLENLRRLTLSLADADYRGEASKAAARAMVSHSAVVAAGAAAGVEVGQWVFAAPGAWGAGGPLQALLNAPDAVLNWQSERGTEARKDIMRLLPLTLDDDGTPAFGTGFPGGLSLSRTLRAYREHDPEFFKIALGFTPLKERDKQRFPYTVAPDLSELGEDTE